MKKWQAFLVTAIVLGALALGVWFFWQPLMNFLNVQSEPLQSADSLVALIVALLSLASGVFSFLSKRSEKITAPTSRGGTGGGAYVEGDVSINGGDFVGRDKTVSNVTVGGDVSGNIVIGDDNRVNSRKPVRKPEKDAQEES